MPHYRFDITILDLPAPNGQRQIIVIPQKDGHALDPVLPACYTPTKGSRSDSEFRTAYTLAVRRATRYLDTRYPGWRTAAT